MTGFKWFSYEGPEEDVEVLDGPYASREEAIAEGSRRYEGRPFTVCESAPAKLSANDARDAFDLEHMCEHLGERWWAVGEDGLSFRLTDEQEQQLIGKLGACLADFLRENNVSLIGVFLDEARSHEKATPDAAKI